ncbi:MAG: dTDP-4-dehydrorhamnose 3,5-epimerase [Mycobacterium sp.]|nr:dTDP-4-dehydrorhamnose 3,5-epimerase [Mycobacterium sp.]
MGQKITAFRELAIPGAWEITPAVHGDNRGGFFEWFTETGFAEMTGHRFELRQANCSTSATGVLRGLHFAQLPPGQAKYVTCVSGAVFDVVVDVRVGSPTFGKWDSGLLDDVDRRTVYLSEGLAHGFLALKDSTVMYLCSTSYDPQREHTIAATDPAIGIDWPIPAGDLLLSDRDAAAPSLAQVRAAGLLPTWDDARAFIASLPRG